MPYTLLSLKLHIVYSTSDEYAIHCKSSTESQFLKDLPMIIIHLIYQMWS